jgi:ribonuclease Y
MLMQLVIVGLAGSIVGIALGVFIRKKMVENKLASAEDYSRKIMLEAGKQAETIRKEAQLQAKDTLYQMKLDFEEETRSRRKELQRQEKRVFQKEEALDKKIEQFEKREVLIANKETILIRKENDLIKQEKEFNSLIEEERRKLEKIAGISASEAKDMLISAMESEARHEASKLIKKRENYRERR